MFLPFEEFPCFLLSRQSHGLDRLVARVEPVDCLMTFSVMFGPLLRKSPRLNGLAARRNIADFKHGTSLSCLPTESLRGTIEIDSLVDTECSDSNVPIGYVF